MFKFIICALLTISFISCNSDGDDPKDVVDPKDPGTVTNPDGNTADPTKQYTLVNKTGDDEAVSVILFSSYEKLGKKDQTDCAPRVLTDGECLTIKGSQFNLVQIVGGDELLCGDITTSCNPGDYEVTREGWFLWTHSFHLSELQEDTEKEKPKTSSNPRKKSQTAAEDTEPKTCTPLKCTKPEAAADQKPEAK